MTSGGGGLSNSVDELCSRLGSRNVLMRTRSATALGDLVEQRGRRVSILCVKAVGPLVEILRSKPVPEVAVAVLRCLSLILDDNVPLHGILLQSRAFVPLIDCIGRVELNDAAHEHAARALACYVASSSSSLPPQDGAADGSSSVVATSDETESAGAAARKLGEYSADRAKLARLISELRTPDDDDDDDDDDELLKHFAKNSAALFSPAAGPTKKKNMPLSEDDAASVGSLMSAISEAGSRSSPLHRRRSAAKRITALAQGFPEMAKLIKHAGGLGDLANVLHQDTTVPSGVNTTGAHEAAVALARCLVRSPDNRAVCAALRHACPSALALLHHTQPSGAWLSSLTLVANMTADNEIAIARVVENNGIAIISAILTAATDHCDGRSSHQDSSLLYNFCDDEEGSVVSSASAAMPTAGVDRICCAASRALRNLAASPINAAAIADRPTLAAIVSCLRATNSETRQHATVTLASITSDDACRHQQQTLGRRSDLRRSAGTAIDSLVAMLRDGPTAGDKRRAAAAIMNISHENENRLLLFRAGVIEPLETATAPGTPAGVRIDVCGTLQNLADVPSIRRSMIAQNSTVGVLLRMACPGKNQLAEMRAACQALSALAGTGAGNALNQQVVCDALLRPVERERIIRPKKRHDSLADATLALMSKEEEKSKKERTAAPAAASDADDVTSSGSLSASSDSSSSDKEEGAVEPSEAKKRVVPLDHVSRVLLVQSADAALREAAAELLLRLSEVQSNGAALVAYLPEAVQLSQQGGWGGVHTKATASAVRTLANIARQTTAGEKQAIGHGAVRLFAAALRHHCTMPRCASCGKKPLVEIAARFFSSLTLHDHRVAAINVGVFADLVNAISLQAVDPDGGEAQHSDWHVQFDQFTTSPSERIVQHACAAIANLLTATDLDTNASEGRAAIIARGRAALLVDAGGVDALTDALRCCRGRFALRAVVETLVSMTFSGAAPEQTDAEKASDLQQQADASEISRIMRRMSADDEASSLSSSRSRGGDDSLITEGSVAHTFPFSPQLPRTFGKWDRPATPFPLNEGVRDELLRYHAMWPLVRMLRSGDARLRRCSSMLLDVMPLDRPDVRRYLSTAAQEGSRAGGARRRPPLRDVVPPGSLVYVHRHGVHVCDETRENRHKNISARRLLLRDARNKRHKGGRRMAVEWTGGADAGVDRAHFPPVLSSRAYFASGEPLGVVHFIVLVPDW